MFRRRLLPAVVALCLVLPGPAVPVASAQFGGQNPGIVVTELPALSELPPLPEGDGDAAGVEVEEPSRGRMSPVQVVALLLALGALLAGGTGLALVTRCGRGEPAGDPGDDRVRSAPTPPGPAR